VFAGLLSASYLFVALLYNSMRNIYMSMRFVFLLVVGFVLGACVFMPAESFASGHIKWFDGVYYSNSFAYGVASISDPMPCPGSSTSWGCTDLADLRYTVLYGGVSGGRVSPSEQYSNFLPDHSAKRTDKQTIWPYLVECPVSPDLSCYTPKARTSFVYSSVVQQYGSVSIMIDNAAGDCESHVDWTIVDCSNAGGSLLVRFTWDAQGGLAYAGLVPLHGQLAGGVSMYNGGLGDSSALNGFNVQGSVYSSFASFFMWSGVILLPLISILGLFAALLGLGWTVKKTVQYVTGSGNGMLTEFMKREHRGSDVSSSLRSEMNEHITIHSK
jgi:hypothetical protein